MKKGFVLDFMWGERFLLEMEQFHDFWGYRPALKSTAHRILRKHLKLHAYKVTIEPRLTNERRNKMKKFIHWVVKNFRSEDTMRI